MAICESSASTGANALPILLVHGWPDSFVRFLKIIPMLANPQAYGGDAIDSFDVVVPSLPGYGFSDKPRKLEMTFDFARPLHMLMVDGLGYSRFAVQGGDWGGMVAEHVARSYASSVIGIHMTDLPFFHMFQKPDDVTGAEQKYSSGCSNSSRRKAPTRSSRERVPTRLPAASTTHPPASRASSTA